MGALSDWFVRRPPPRTAHLTAGLADARVLVCGASGALGAAIASALADDGAHVYLHAHRNMERVASACSALQQDHGEGRRFASGAADLRDESAATALVMGADSVLEGLDVIVTAIGSAKDAPLPLVTADDIAQTMQDNLLPVVHVCEAFTSLITRRQGNQKRPCRIVNVSSVTGMVGQPMRVAYGASKGAVVSYTKSLARELASEGVTANIVAPQVIDGGLADLMKARVRSLLLANTPVGRTCLPGDVAHAVRYLASPASSFVTGTVLTVSGGLVTW